MNYTIDQNCCEHIDQYIADQEAVIKTLEDIARSIKSTPYHGSFRDLLASYGLGAGAVAAGGVSPAVAAKAQCYQDAIADIESNNIVNGVQALTLAAIGAVLYNPVALIFHSSSWSQDREWFLSRLAIELGRAMWLLGKLKIIKASCIDVSLNGTIKIVNDCDGALASIPDVIRLEAQLADGKGTTKTGGADVPLVPAGGNNPVKTGTFSLPLHWMRDPQTGAPVAGTWQGIKFTRTDGTSICNAMDGGLCAPKICKDHSQLQPPLPIPLTGATTQLDVSWVCFCDDP